MDIAKTLAGILPGKKTYIAAAGLAVLAFLQYRSGNVDAASQSVLTALAFLGLRNAVEPKTPPAPPAAPAA